MYRVLKEKGHNETILLENIDNDSQIIIGRVSMNILDILTAEGIVFNTEDGKKVNDEWNFEVSTKTGHLLSKEALRINKPERAKDITVKPTKEMNNKKIDAMDVLLGLANYK